MKLNEMKEVLFREGIRLTKSLGQNFLHDQNQLRRIVAAAELSADDFVLEVGPGLGPLTEVIRESGATVQAVELDGRLAAILRRQWPETEKFQLIEADALALAREGSRIPSALPPGWKLVSNLPYSVASPLLVELALAENRPERMVTTLQLEVADRIMARTDERNYGVLTLLLQLSYEPVSSFRIPAACFFPEPEIDSACIVLKRRPTPLLPAGSEKIFRRVVKTAFSQRRKMMVKLLKQEWPAPLLLGALEKLGIAPQARAEDVSLEQFVALTRALSNP